MWLYTKHSCRALGAGLPLKVVNIWQGTKQKPDGFFGVKVKVYPVVRRRLRNYMGV